MYRPVTEDMDGIEKELNEFEESQVEPIRGNDPHF